MYDLLARYSDTILMEEKENCPFARRRPHWQFFHSLPSYERVTENKLIVDGCIQLGLNLIMRNDLRKPNTLYIVMTRNYADMLWSSYNFWCRWDVDGPTCDSSKWAMVSCTSIRIIFASAFVTSRLDCINAQILSFTILLMLISMERFI